MSAGSSKLSVAMAADGLALRIGDSTTLQSRLCYQGQDVDLILAEHRALETWKQAVIDALVVSHAYKAEHDTDPHRAVADLLGHARKAAVDGLLETQRAVIAIKRPLTALREQFELEYSRKQGHTTRSALLFHRRLDGRYSNRSLQALWMAYRREHMPAGENAA